MLGSCSEMFPMSMQGKLPAGDLDEKSPRHSNSRKRELIAQAEKSPEDNRLFQESKKDRREGEEGEHRNLRPCAPQFQPRIRVELPVLRFDPLHFAGVHERVGDLIGIGQFLIHCHNLSMYEGARQVGRK
jgi:hypothetical protein